MSTFKPCCKPQRHDADSESIEIYDAESAEEAFLEEEEEELFVEEEELDLDMADMELECMKYRIDDLQLMLKDLITDDFGEETSDVEAVCKDLQICSEKKDICTLQKTQHRLQCEFDRLVVELNLLRTQVKNERVRLCEQAREMIDLQNEINDILVWKDTIALQYGICIERNEYIKHVKVRVDDMMIELTKAKNEMLAALEKYVEKNCYKIMIKTISDQLAETNKLYEDLVASEFERLRNLEERLGIPPEVSSYRLFKRTFESFGIVKLKIQNWKTCD